MKKSLSSSFIEFCSSLFFISEIYLYNSLYNCIYNSKNSTSNVTLFSLLLKLLEIKLSNNVFVISKINNKNSLFLLASAFFIDCVKFFTKDALYFALESARLNLNKSIIACLVEVSVNNSFLEEIIFIKTS